MKCRYYPLQLPPPLFRDEETEATKWEDQDFINTQKLMEEINGKPWSSSTQPRISLYSTVSNSSQVIFIGKTTKNFNSLLKLPLPTLWSNIIFHCGCQQPWMGFWACYFYLSRNTTSKKELNNSPSYCPTENKWHYHFNFKIISCAI